MSDTNASSGNTDPVEDGSDASDGTLADADLEKPSTGYEPGEEPTSPDDAGDEPSHEAVGIGIVETAPLDPPDDADATDASAS